jgi:uncharacterized YigZ family protein
MNGEFYNTIEKGAISEFKDKGSRFIAFAFPIDDTDDFKTYRTQLKKEHSKANHHCFAYRLGFDGMNYRISDDGEPSGSAGRPILGQIDSRQLTNILIVVVRYFGGTLLGIPGLINAYKTTAAFALQQASIIQKPVLIYYRLQFDYMLMNDIMKLVKQYDCMVLKQDMQLFCLMDIGVPKASSGEMLLKLKELRNVEISQPFKYSF